jgi:uncharacterized membrane protein
MAGMSREATFLVIIWGLFWLGACLRSMTYWIVVVFLAVMLQWIDKVPIAYEHLDNIEHWWLFGCNVLVLIIIAQAGYLRDALAKRKQSRILSGMDRNS